MQVSVSDPPYLHHNATAIGLERNKEMRMGLLLQVTNTTRQPNAKQAAIH